MPTEAEIRQENIDKQLAEAGWSRGQGNLVTEAFLSGTKKQIREGSLDDSYPARNESNRAFADYVMLGKDGKPLAVLEAKRDSRSPLEGERQASEYAERIYRQTGKLPFIFLSNGDETYFLDKGRYPARRVNGFFTTEDLERLDLLRQYSQQLHLFSPDPSIVERDYQLRAIQTITDGMRLKRRKFLLVMATGTGKTRTTIALVQMLIRASWVRRVLFLADRRELVKQAEDAFKDHIPDESRVRIEGGAIKADARIHFATYPSMMQVFSQLSTGYYDLIIADESHRSIYRRYGDIFRHFDAMQIGLTATPTDYIDHNTFDLFGCSDDAPTFDYPFETAVKNDHLVNFKVLEAQTRFQVEGIKWDELPPDLQRQVDEQGLERSEIDFGGSDLERKVTNTGTNDRLVDEFVDSCRKDVNGIPAKSIIFAISHKHAIELLESFNRRYPDWQAQGLAQVIDSRMERAEKTLEDFKLKDMPRVAISVDMLDTGIDVPAIQTLVFAKPVFSQVKFWQMIGRGTRLWRDPLTGERKADFLIVDHWENFKYFDKNPEGEISNPSEPLPARLFRARLRKLALLRERDDQAMIEVTLAQLHTMLEELPRHNVRVREHNTRLDTLQADATWMQEDLSAQGQLSRVAAPLMRFLQVDVYSTLFELHTENLAIAFLQGQQETIERLRVQIKDELRQLARDLPEVRAREPMLAWVESTDFWTHLSLQRILDLQIQLSPIMRYRQSEQRTIIKLYLPDVMKRRRWITYGPAGEGAFVDHYQGEVETHVKELAEQVPTLLKIKRSEIPEAEEMQALAEVLNTPDLFIREEILQQVYENPEMRLVDFMRHILDVQRFPSREQRIKAAFQRYVGAHPNLTVVQRSFLFAVRALLIRQADEQTALTVDQLSQAPFNRIGKVEELFNDHELAELLDFANTEVA